jgi:hypothetical protein
MFIGLNPSTADEIKSDPTVTRCINYAVSWGYNGMFMANIFAIRGTDPKILKEVEDPVGAENDYYLYQMAEQSQLIVCAWGDHGKLLGRGQKVRTDFHYRVLSCLSLNMSGEPSHPLYLRKDLRPISY